MKSWKTTIGGSLETLGTGIRDLSTLGALVQAGTGDLQKANLWLILSGSIICMIGKFFSNLFAADSSALVAAHEDLQQQITAVKADTTQITKEVHGQ